MDRVLQLNEFFVEGNRQELSHVVLHITEPSTPEEMEKGYFFAVCEVTGGTKEQLMKLQATIDRAENEYYEIPDDGEKISLETVLEHINQERSALVGDQGGFHAVVGAIRDPSIYFACSGSPEILLFYKNRQGVHQQMNLAEEANEGAGQLFSHIVQGKISPEDFLFVATPQVRKYFSSDRLHKIIVSRSGTESAQHIERVLSDIRDGFSFGGLIISIKRGHADAVKRLRPTSVGAGGRSLSNLFTTERTTASTLSPSLWSHLSEKMGRFTTLFPSAPAASAPRKAAHITAAHVSVHQSKKIARPLWQERFLTVSRMIGRVFVVLGRGSIAVIGYLYYFLHGFFRTLLLAVLATLNYQNRRSVILEGWRRDWRGFKEWIRLLPVITKTLLVAGILVAAISVGSFFSIKNRQEKQAATQKFTETTAAVRNRKDAAESALIYKDIDQAFIAYREAVDAFETLVCKSKEDKTTCADLKNQLTELGGRVRKIVVVTPSPVINLPDLLPEAEAALFTNIIKIKTKLVAFGSATSTLVIYDTLTKESARLPGAADTPGFTHASVPKENDYALFMAADKRAFVLNPDTSTLTASELPLPPNADIRAAIIYNRRLYVVDAGNRQVLRYDSVRNGWGGAKEWLKEPVAGLADAVSAAIDGDIFVTTKSGTILRLSGGMLQPFILDGLDPVLSGDSVIWTYNDMPYLYILDRTEKRFVLLEKDGRLKEQQTHSAWQALTGFAPDSQNNTIYGIDRGNIFSLPLPR